MVDKISGVGQNPMPQNPQEPAKKANDKQMFIMRNTTLNEVMEGGSKAQQLVAKAFADKDLNPNNYDEEEAKIFNQFYFTLNEEAKELTAYNKATTTKVILKYQDESQIENYAYLIRDAADLKGGTVTCNIAAKALEYDGCSTDKQISIGGKLNNVQIKNCDLTSVELFYFNGHLHFTNTCHVGSFMDSDVKVFKHESQNANVTNDRASRIDRKYKE